ncbi:Late embryogenesis abundant (LEA) protein-related [Euphorbia peplus]|nr:Late embryogenesis abundant (LEA) protein-related [Euphorbia peplus]
MADYSSNKVFIIVVVLVCSAADIYAANITCRSRGPCFLKLRSCPVECPLTTSSNPNAKVCFLNCNSPVCKPECKHRIPNCNSPGSACFDPRFIGGDGIVFYFHGKSNQHFSLVSDPNLQINARFVGLRPLGRTRDFTWIQALGFLFNSHTFSLEATRAETWDDEIDHLKFTHNGNELVVPAGHLSWWQSPESNIRVDRTLSKNSVLITLPEVAEIWVKVVHVTKEDDRIHGYQIPLDDCFTHLQVQFKFYSLSSGVEGVLGRTYQAEFENPAKPGVAMPVVGGEDKYRTTSLLSADCRSCLFSPAEVPQHKDVAAVDFGMLDCSAGSNGHGIVCRK